MAEISNSFVDIWWTLIIKLGGLPNYQPRLFFQCLNQKYFISLNVLHRQFCRCRFFHGIQNSLRYFFNQWLNWRFPTHKMLLDWPILRFLCRTSNLVCENCQHLHDFLSRVIKITKLFPKSHSLYILWWLQSKIFLLQNIFQWKLSRKKFLHCKLYGTIELKCRNHSFFLYSEAASQKLVNARHSAKYQSTI